MGARLRDAAGGAHKALLLLDGQPLVRRALERLQGCGQLTGAVVATHADDFAAMETCLGSLRQPGFELYLTPGGATRQASCHAALQEAYRRTPPAARAGARVLFHDAARPFVDPAEVRAVLAALAEAPAAVLATPVAQTVKRADAGGKVAGTVPREGLYLAQTPQGFRLNDAMAVYDRAAAEGLAATDDVALAESYGLPVKIVPGSAWNLKITTPDDLPLAQALLKLQGPA